MITTRIGMPLETFIDQHEAHPFELINGRKQPIMPTLAGHNFVLQLLYQRLLVHLMGAQTAEVMIEATYILPDRYDANWVLGSRTPDLMIVDAELLAAYRKTDKDWRGKPYLIVPVIVVEIISTNDRYTDIDEKVDAYLEDGVRMVVLIDPQRRKGVIRTSDARPIILEEQDVLRFGDLLPGFEVSLAELFGMPDEQRE